jgi:iron complex outermembrane recepter protein
MNSAFNFVILAATFCIPGIGGAESSSQRFYSTDELRRLSLDDLAKLDVIVTTASKKAENIFDAPTAVFVIAQEAIRRSGVATIPEALRLAPGVQVARIGANSWAISSRGFNGRFASKLLVLIDGRTVYSPLFSGVFWNAQDYLLEDIDRIEVIRGPGATIWGPMQSMA